MNKSELIRQLAERAELSRGKASRVVDALFSTEDGVIVDALRSGDRVHITGFGSFETRLRGARKGRNPRTGKEIGIAAGTSAAFRTGKGLKDAVGGTHGPGEGMRIGPIHPAGGTHGPGEGM